MILFGKEFRLRPHSCATCAAKDQTITLLADVVDWHRSQAPAPGPAMPQLSAYQPHVEVADPAHQLWASEEQEDIESALEQGAVNADWAAAALAQVRARNTTIERVS